MKILVSGSKGQLGQCLQLKQNKLNAEWIFTDIEQLNIADAEQVDRVFSDINPDVMINCAAYTAVDKAEEETEIANSINHIASENLARACTKYQCQFIHVSTDYVFDGKGHKPYNETDDCKPQSAYGDTKLKGEQAALKENPNSIIIRTSWLYSEFGNNFMKTMIRLGSERDLLTVVADQIGTPTYAGSLADGIIHIINRYQNNCDNWIAGVYHYSNQGVCSWYDFALWIMQNKKLSCKVKPIDSSQFPMIAKRPHYSVLNKAKFENNFEFEIPHWTISAQNCIDKL